MLGSHIDITDRKRDEEALNQRVEFERLISQISSHFINLNPDDADEGINHALASIGSFTGADRAYIFQYKAGGTAKMDNTHEWCAEGIEPQIENLKDITLEKELPWFLERILGREALHVPDVKSLPPEAHLEREHFESQDIQSLVVVPMVFRDQDIGFLGFDSVRARRAWTAEEAGLLKLVGETITHTIISKRNELALRKSEEEFRQVYEHMAIGVARVSLDYLIEAANDAYCSMLGYSEKELIGKHLKDITHPEILDENLSKQSQLARGEIDHFRMDKTFIHKNGSVLYGILDANLIRNVDGKPSYFIGSALDITDRKKAEDALRESEEKYRLLVENADEAIFIAQDDIIKFPNPKTLELTGYSEEELATTPFAEFIHSEDRQMVVERYRRRLNGESPPSDYAFRIINKSNSVLWVQNNVAPTTWDGRPATINLLRDITEKRRLEEQLSQSEKLEAIATLTGGIAHDYNNLLSIIVGNLGLARQDAKPGSEQAQFLNEAEKAARKVGDLTHELMALSRGGGPIKELGPIRELLMASADVISADSGITVNVSIQGDLWPVPHDSRKMATVFRNVVQNALEAMPAGGEFTIQARNLLVEDGDAVSGSPVKPGNYVRIQFRDNGKGIPEEYLDKIYDPYFSTKPMGVQKGMGLGLATAHAIVKKHGGEIIVESTPDAGATVNIYLPAQPEEGDGEDGKPVSSATQSTVADRQAPMGRILLMDDEEMLRNLAKQMLNRLGYEVKTVKDGIEAIEVYRKQLGSANPFDAVILDLTIKGGMGGEQALRELLKIDPDVNAIVASGYFNDPVMTDFHDYGFKGAMAKPYEMKDLRGAIEKVLSVKN
jgi:PAS domain S-box-containing protein